MAMPNFTMRQLLEAGVHFGHNTRRWNPKMSPYIFGARNNVHIIDLQQTVPLLQRAMNAVREVAAAGGRVLFVGTKRQASRMIAQSAERCGQFYVDHRWLGGMLTNWATIQRSIARLKALDAQLGNEEETQGLTKKELLQLTRERDKLEKALGGIKEMSALPDIVVVIDTNKEAIAVAEANKLKIPVIAVIDSNSDPDGIDFPVPGNDDSLRAIEIYMELFWGAVLDGLAQEVALSGGDLGEAEAPLPEELPDASAEGEAAAAGTEPAESAEPGGAPEKGDGPAPEGAPVAAPETVPEADSESAPEPAGETAAEGVPDTAADAAAETAETPEAEGQDAEPPDGEAKDTEAPGAGGQAAEEQPAEEKAAG